MSEKTMICPLDEDCRNKINETHDAVLTIVAEFREVQGRVKTHSTVLYGNGKPGLIEEIAFVRTLKKAFWIVATSAIGLVVSGTGAGIVWVIVHINVKK